MHGRNFAYGTKHMAAKKSTKKNFRARPENRSLHHNTVLKGWIRKRSGCE